MFLGHHLEFCHRLADRLSALAIVVFTQLSLLLCHIVVLGHISIHELDTFKKLAHESSQLLLVQISSLGATTAAMYIAYCVITTTVT